jgi:uncharacterized membrane protein (UPF0127 family)
MATHLWMVLCVAACTRDARHRGRKLDPVAPVTVTVGTGRVTVELADNVETIRRGLMHRTLLAPDAGMLFLMGSERDHAFWMKDTSIALDIIFIGHDHRVVGVLRDMVPMSERGRRVGAPSSYVLEVNAGWAAAHHVAVGAVVELDNLAP